MHVAFQPSRGGEGVATQFTMLQTGLGVFYGFMILTGLLGSKCLLTVGAHEGGFPCVNSHVVD